MRRKPGKLSAPATAAEVAAAGATYGDPASISSGSLTTERLEAEGSDGCGEVDSSLGEIHETTGDEGMTATSASTVLLEPSSTMSRKREEQTPASLTKYQGSSCRQEGFPRGRRKDPVLHNRRCLDSLGNEA